MSRKKLIAAAVAAACACPLLAAATGVEMHAMTSGHWEAMTPSSVDESAPWRAAERSHLGGGNAVADSRSTGATLAAFGAPQSVSESAPWMTDDAARRAAGEPTRVASLPNPHTPSAANESGGAHHAEDMRHYAEQLAAIEEARIAALSAETETLASGAVSGGSEAYASSETPGERESERMASASTALVDSRITSGSLGLQEIERGATDLPASRGDAVPAGEAALAAEASALAQAQSAFAPGPDRPAGASAEIGGGTQPRGAIETESERGAATEGRVEGSAELSPQASSEIDGAARRDPDAARFTLESGRAAETPAETREAGTGATLGGNADVTVHGSGGAEAGMR